MRYRGKAIELVSEKKVLNQRVAWIRILEDNTFHQVPYEDLENVGENWSIEKIRFVAIAGKIKDEVAKKNILAPYESSLIPLPHQILVLEKVMQSMENRFLLADEVGMGKTIECGLILKELKLRGDINRILVIVPKSAMLQWQSELKEHFNEVFHVYDSELISSLARTFSNINADEEFNFWRQHNQIIVSTDALKPLESRKGWSKDKIDEYNKYRLEAVLDADFDLIVFDEVHKMGGASPTVSRYKLAQELCNSTPNVLLLSATPHRGKSDHFRRVLQLLDPDAFSGEGLPEIKELEPYVIRTEKRLAVDYEGSKLFNQRQTIRLDVELDSSQHHRQIALYDAVTEYVRKGFNAAKKSKNKASGLIMVLFQRLASSSTAAIHSAMSGRLQRLIDGDLDETSYEESDLDNDLVEESIDFDGLYQYDSQGFANEEKMLRNLVSQAETCLNNEVDAKAECLVKTYNKLQAEYNNPDLKVLVFTEFRTTQKMLVDYLKGQGYRCSFIHGGQELDDRKVALTEFKNDSQFMIATDAAGESLNMQFSHICVNYDLPWNPMIIEQRIGRVDRIGQKNIVKAYNMFTDNSVDARVYEIIEEKLNRILHQLGIDKTSDVLDSTLDVKKVNKLYLQSLLDPSKLEFTGDRWLHEIKAKLKDYQSTESALPEVSEEEIDYKKASEVKHSPLPQWLEGLIESFVLSHNGSIKKSLIGYSDISVNGISKRVTFDSEISLDNPSTEHITLQNDWVKSLLNDIGDIDPNSELPVLRSSNSNETSGIWSLWTISAIGQEENKQAVQPFFIADSGKQFSAYANDIWNRLLNDKGSFQFTTETEKANVNISETLEQYLLTAFENLAFDLNEKMQKKLENKTKSFEFQSSRIKKIGIKNIRDSKMTKLKSEYEKWVSEFKKNQKVIPDLKHLISIRIHA